MPEPEPLPLPLITLACLCERVLEDRDGVVSIIRVIDRFVIQGDLPDGVVALSQATLVIGVKWQGHTGRHHFTVDVSGPIRHLDQLLIPVDIVPGLTGINAVINVTLPFEKPGHGRVEIAFDGVPFTAVPFDAVPAPTALAAPTSPSTIGRAD